ncbi:MAG: serine/threonine-protein kinase [Gammaproteobacteria bacterium]|nr:serine/threonine-protein kinase [Gammaproteobacteria bacterium]
MNEKDRDTHPDERFQRIEALFHAVADLGPEAASNYLDRHARDPAERAEVEQLLAADASGSAEAALSSLVPAAIEAEQAAERDALIGSRIGPWKLTGSYGVGGMGVVYRAERDDGAFRQLAAVKLVRGLAVSELQVARFVAERQILARLEHPGIARLLDGGSHDGVPWLAMEAVDGQPIDLWCRSRPMAERLTLFIKVCEAVQYAHSNLIIHRDLKPSNVLVDSTNQPKLLDFGIAKLIQADDTIDERTRTQFRMLTPEFASPEQLLGEPVTTASDVYSLGVLLFRLLTGISPYATTEDGKRNPAALAASDDTITRPSAAVLRGETDSTRGAAGRQLARSLRGDLDAIVMKALRRDAGKRYASAAALGDDLRRHLDLLPVLARKESARYQMARFARRHWQGMIAAAAGVAVIAGTVAYYTDALAQRSRDAEAVSDFVVGLIAKADIEKNPDGLTLRQLLEDGASRSTTELAGQPAVRARVRRALGEAWTGMGEPALSFKQYRAALDDYRQVYGVDALETLAVEADWLLAGIDENDDAQHQKLAVDALTRAEARWGTDHPVLIPLLLTQAQISITHNQATAEQIAMLDRAQALLTRNRIPRSDRRWLLLYGKYCRAYAILQDDARSIAACQQGAALAKANGDARAERDQLFDLSQAAFEANRAGLAREAAEGALTIAERAFPPTHPRLAFYRAAVSFACRVQGDYDCMARLSRGESRPDPATATSLQRRIYAANVLVRFELAMSARDPDRMADAVRELKAFAVDPQYEGILGEEDFREGEYHLARIRRDGRAQLAQARWQLDQAQTQFGETDPRTQSMRLHVADASLTLGDRDAARRELALVQTQTGIADAGDNPDRAGLLVLQAQAERQPNAAREALALLTRLGVDNAQMADVQQALAELLPPGSDEARQLRQASEANVARARRAVGDP